MQTFVINYAYDFNGQVIAACAMDKQGNMGMSICSKNDRPDKQTARDLAILRMTNTPNKPVHFNDYTVTTENSFLGNFSENQHVKVVVSQKVSSMIAELQETVRDRYRKYFKVND